MFRNERPLGRAKVSIPLKLPPNRTFRALREDENMSLVRTLRGLAVILATVGMVAGPFAYGAGPATGAPAVFAPAAAARVPEVLDVELLEGGVLLGQVTDRSGAPLRQTEVLLRKDGVDVLRVRTEEEGRFAAAGLRGGVYEVVAADSTSHFRVWAPRTAPPAAQPGILIVAGDGVVRGNLGYLLYGWLSHPWVLAALTTAAIAVPIALDAS
jgi:hypothetical protein